MTPRRRERKTLVLILAMVVAGSVGDVLLGVGMKQIGAVTQWTPGALVALAVQVFTHPLIWLGIAALALYFLCYILVLSWADYSYVLPASASSYAVVALLGYGVLGEQVSALRWTGVTVICLGVACVGLTPHDTRGTPARGADRAA